MFARSPQSNNFGSQNNVKSVALSRYLYLIKSNLFDFLRNKAKQKKTKKIFFQIKTY